MAATKSFSLILTGNIKKKEIFIVHYFSTKTLCPVNKSCVRIKALIFSASQVAEFLDHRDLKYQWMYQYIFCMQGNIQEKKKEFYFYGFGQGCPGMSKFGQKSRIDPSDCLLDIKECKMV